MKSVDKNDEKKTLKIIANYRKAFTKMLLMISFPDLDKPFDYGSDDDYDLWKPTSKAVFLILFLYSMEPPFYAALNQACRTLD